MGAFLARVQWAESTFNKSRTHAISEIDTVSKQAYDTRRNGTRVTFRIHVARGLWKIAEDTTNGFHRSFPANLFSPSLNMCPTLCVVRV